MPRPCTVCTHKQRADIDHMIVEGQPNRRIAAQFAVSESSIRRHRASHLPAKLAKAEEAKQSAEATSLMDRVRSLCDRSERLLTGAEDILAAAKQLGDPRTALEAIRTAAQAAREFRGHFGLLAQITGELRHEGPKVNIGQAVIISPPQLPPGAPCRLGEDPWQRALPEPVDVEVVEGPGDTGEG